MPLCCKVSIKMLSTGQTRKCNKWWTEMDDDCKATCFFTLTLIYRCVHGLAPDYLAHNIVNRMKVHSYVQDLWVQIPFILGAAKLTGAGVLSGNTGQDCGIIFLATLTLKWPRYFYSRWCPRGVPRDPSVENHFSTGILQWNLHHMCMDYKKSQFWKKK